MKGGSQGVWVGFEPKVHDLIEVSTASLCLRWARAEVGCPREAMEITQEGGDSGLNESGHREDVEKGCDPGHIQKTAVGRQNLLIDHR